MPNTSRKTARVPRRIRTIALSAALIIAASLPYADCLASTILPRGQCDPTRDATPIKHLKNTIFSVLCTKSRAELTLSFNTRTGRLAVSNGIRKNTLEIVDSQYNPEMVGAQKYIRFLPPDLQVYQESGVIMYLSAVRSTGGGGGGQCGSGMEIFLNSLSVKTNRRIARVLVDSCLENIELSSFTGTRDKVDAFRSMNNRLDVNFVNYRNMPNSVVGHLSDDYSAIQIY